MPYIVAMRNGDEGRRNRRDVMARIKAIEINDIKLLSDSFLAGSIGSIGELETSIRE